MQRLRIKPHVFVLVVGVLVMLGAFFSGIFPRITEWHEESPIHREVFINIPDALNWAFYVTVAIMLLIDRVARRRCGSGTTSGARPTTAAPTRRTSSAASRDFRRGVWMQTLLRDPAAGVMHSLHLLRLHRSCSSRRCCSRSTTSSPSR